jgi:hypothetical protein
MDDMTYNSGVNVLVGNSNFELHLLKLKTSWNHVNLHSWKLVNIPIITIYSGTPSYITLPFKL